MEKMMSNSYLNYERLSIIVMIDWRHKVLYLSWNQSILYANVTYAIYGE